MILTREQMLKVQGRGYKTIPVPELGGEVRMASLSAGVALEFAALAKRREAGEDVNQQIMLLLIESSIVDEKGATLFDKASALEFLGRISIETCNLIVGEALALKPNLVPPGNSEASPTAA
jgi:hypothetical protein